MSGEPPLKKQATVQSTLSFALTLARPASQASIVFVIINAAPPTAPRNGKAPVSSSPKVKREAEAQTFVRLVQIFVRAEGANKSLCRCLTYEKDGTLACEAPGEKESDEGFTLTLLSVPPHIWVRLSRSGYVPGLLLA